MSRVIKISDELYSIAKTRAKPEHMSVPGQIEYWAKLGKIGKDNPDLPISFIEDILISKAEIESGEYSEFEID